ITADGLGISFGFLYGQLNSSGTPAFNPSTGELMQQRAMSRPGISTAILYEFGKPTLTYRIGAEAQFLYTYLAYDKKNDTKYEAYIHPVTVNIPVTATYHLQRKPKLSFGFGPSFSIPVGQFSSERPANKNFNTYLDFILSKKIHTGKNNMRIELGFALGLFNMIDTSAEDPYTSVVDQAKRNVYSLKIYFN
ncbi:MAG: hypothetical protein ACOYLH_08940, partial [Flavobacteriales bacterium]